jgi:carboxypeptidase C (cathepsin A)
MTGESYGVGPASVSLLIVQGRYLPVFASAVYDQNEKILQQGRTPINLQSVMIGNGGTSLCM